MPQRSPKILLKTTRTYLRHVYTILGVLVALLGSIATVFSPKAMDMFIDNLMQLKPGSTIVEMWRHPDVNVSLDIFFLNWTNSHQFYDLSTKPKFQQVGPYSYDEMAIKKILKWHPENSTMVYGKQHLYYFRQDRTNGSLDDRLVTINALLAGAASKTRYWSYMKQTVIDLALKFYQNRVAWKKTADEFLFGGFDDELLNLLGVFPASFRDSLNLLIPWDKIGFIYGRNGSVDYLGTHTIHTGVGDMSMLGKLVQWKGKNYTKAFPPACNGVEASAGEFQQTHLRKHEPLTYFFAEFCRRVQFDYVDEVMVEGVRGYKYVLSPSIFDNGTTYPESKCFCNDMCVPRGAMNIVNCWFGLPLFVSEPHFLNGDPHHLRQVEGLQPNRSAHTSHIILEPRTGLLLQLKGRLQVNLYLEPNYHIRSFPCRRKMLFPIMWFDMNAGVNQKSASILYWVTHMGVCLQAVGFLVACLGIALLLWQPFRRLWNRRYAHHMKISTLVEDECDQLEAEALRIKEFGTTERLYWLPQKLPSLLYARNPRRSLPIVVTQRDEEGEALTSHFADESSHHPRVESDKCVDRAGLS